MTTPNRSCRLVKNVDVLCITTPRGKGVSTSVYQVCPLEPDKAVAQLAFRLQKLNGDRECWTIHHDEHGFHCTCPSKTYRPDEGDCKHIRAAIACGLAPPSKVPPRLAQDQEPPPF